MKFKRAISDGCLCKRVSNACQFVRFVEKKGKKRRQKQTMPLLEEILGATSRVYRTFPFANYTVTNASWPRASFRNSSK